MGVPVANLPVFVFGSSGNKQSTPISPPKFPDTGSFNFTLKPASSEPNIFGSTKLGTFNFTMKSATSTPSIFDNTNVTFLQPTEKEMDSGEVDSQNEEWVTESESEYLGSEYNLDQSENENNDDDNSELVVGSSVNNTLTDDIDSSITSVNTLVDQQGDSSTTEELLLDSHTPDDSSGETQEQ